MTIYMLHAKRTDIKHDFIELFTSMEKLQAFLHNNLNVVKQQITLHDVDSMYN